MLFHVQKRLILSMLNFGSKSALPLNQTNYTGLKLAHSFRTQLRIESSLGATPLLPSFSAASPSQTCSRGALARSYKTKRSPGRISSLRKLQQRQTSPKTAMESEQKHESMKRKASATEEVDHPPASGDAVGPSAPADPQQQKRKKAKGDSAQATRNHTLNMAAKTQDPKVALQVFEDSLQEGAPPLTLHQFNMMISILVGDTWEAKVRSRAKAGSFSPSHTGPEARCSEVFAKCQEEATRTQQPIPEAVVTGFARAAALRGDPEEALRLAHTLPGGQKLRTFHPALLGFTLQGQWERALEIESTMRAMDLEINEAEYQLMLEACIKGAAPEATVRALLLRFSDDVVNIKAETVALLQEWFGSGAAAAAFAAGGRLEGKGARWVLDTEAVSAEGKCSAGTLAAVDLDEAEYKKFKDGIARLAMEREKTPNDFKSFQGWLERNGPHDIIIDGANVALFGQNTSGLAFQFHHIQKTVRELKHRHPEKKVLVVLHTRRLNSPEANQPQNRAMVEELKRAKEIYASPVGSNDDWYWLYACTKAGGNGLLVSNDEMRDHIFQLLAPKYFLKWKQRHQTKYSFTPTAGPYLYFPPAFTACVQELEGGGWVFPLDGEENQGKFLVVKPGPAAAEAEGGQ